VVSAIGAFNAVKGSEGTRMTRSILFGRRELYRSVLSATLIGVVEESQGLTKTS
jgi:hypothetical protein